MKTNNNNNHLHDLHAHITETARKATAGTLKLIHANSGLPLIGDLHRQLIADFHTIDHGGAFEYDDAMDVFHEAYAYLWEQIAVNGLTADSIVDTEHNKTVFQMACKAVSAWVWKHKQRPATRHAYIDNGEQEVQIPLYWNIDNIAEWEETQAIIDALELQEVEERILWARLRGYSMEQIAQSVGVSQQAISKRVAKLRKRTAELFPEKARAYINK